jgi:hypothetical protein
MVGVAPLLKAEVVEILTVLLVTSEESKDAPVTGLVGLVILKSTDDIEASLS